MLRAVAAGLVASLCLMGARAGCPPSTAPDYTGAFLTSSTGGGGSNPVGTSAGVHWRSGAVYFAVGFWKNVKFGNDSFSALASNLGGIVLAKLDPTATEVTWAQSFPCTGGYYSNVPYNLAVDQATGNVYVPLKYAYGITLGSYTFSTGQNGCVTSAIAKMAPDGTVLWAITLQNDCANGAVSYGHASAADPATGNAAWAGSFMRSVTFPNGQTLAVSPSNSVDCYVAKLDPAGNILWLKHWMATTPNTISNVYYTDFYSATGEIYAVGYFKDSLVVDGKTLTGDPADRNAFIVKLDANGEVLWTRNLAAGSQYFSVSVDQRTGDAYVAGAFWGPITVGSYSFTPSCGGCGNALMIKFTAAGTVAWAVRFTGNTGASAGALGAANDLWVEGQVTGTMTAGDFTLTATPGSYETFVARLCAATGAVLYAEKFQTAPSSYSYVEADGITVNRLTGAAYPIGAIGGSMTVGPQTISTSGYDSWITSLGTPRDTTSLDVRMCG